MRILYVHCHIAFCAGYFYNKQAPPHPGPEPVQPSEQPESTRELFIQMAKEEATDPVNAISLLPGIGQATKAAKTAYKIAKLLQRINKARKLKEAWDNYNRKKEVWNEADRKYQQWKKENRQPVYNRAG